MHHLETIAIMALAAMGMWTAMGEGMILEWWRTFLEKRVSPFWQKPLAICPRCMVTLFGTAAVMALGWQFQLVEGVVYVVCAVGLQELVQR